MLFRSRSWTKYQKVAQTVLFLSCDIIVDDSFVSIQCSVGHMTAEYSKRRNDFLLVSIRMHSCAYNLLWVSKPISSSYHFFILSVDLFQISSYIQGIWNAIQSPAMIKCVNKLSYQNNGSLFTPRYLYFLLLRNWWAWATLCTSM